MNAKKAKLLRQTVYCGMDYRDRIYDTLLNGQVINGPTTLRSVYQQTKRLYKNDKYTSKV